MEKRVFENPVVKDKVTLLETAKETNGAYTLVEVELAPGGGTPVHYHTTFAEEFTAVEGDLGLLVNKEKIILQPGQQAVAHKQVRHRFFNPGKGTIRFQVRITPSDARFEQGLCIGYGLAEDGLTNKQGIPKKLDHLAFLLELSDSNFPGFFSLIQPYLMYRAKKVRKKGLDKELLAKYCYTS